MELASAVNAPIREFASESVIRKVEAYSGIRVAGHLKKSLQNQIQQRMSVHFIDRISDYLELLNSSQGHEEVAELTKAVLIHETFIEREPHQMRLLETTILPRLFKKYSKVNIICAGCSNGTEAFEIALLAKTLQQKDFPSVHFNVHGLDISGEMIRQARTGIIPERSIRQAKKTYCNEWIKPVEGGLKVEPGLMEHITFRPHNLVDPFPVVGASLIICRNVLIYMNRLSRFASIESFYQGLVPGGYLVLGSSESAHSFRTLFERLDYPETFIYQRL